MLDPTIKDVAITMNSPLSSLLERAVEAQSSLHYTTFDLNGRPITFVVVTNDAAGVTNMLEAYRQSRDNYANEVANAVAADIAKNGLPDPNNPKPFNIIGE